MYIDKKSVSAIHTSQIAYPVGPNKDSYSISSWYKQDVNTLEITVEHELIKNWMCNEKKEGVVYKEGTKFKELLFKGTYNECVQFFMDNVMNTQKEWIRDEHFNYVYPE